MYSPFAVVYLLMEETVCWHSQHLRRSRFLPHIRPHTSHTAPKMLFSLHWHWIFFFIFSVFCVSTPWELRLKNHPERKIRARWPSRRLLFDVDQVVPVLISPTLHRSVRLPTPTVAITRGLQKYLQFQYHRRRCKDFPPTWYRPGKRKEKALRAIDAASMSIKFREIKLW